MESDSSDPCDEVGYPNEAEIKKMDEELNQDFNLTQDDNVKERLITSSSASEADKHPGVFRQIQSVCLMKWKESDGCTYEGTGFLAKIKIGDTLYFSFCTAGHNILETNGGLGDQKRTKKEQTKKNKQLVNFSSMKLNFNPNGPYTKKITLKELLTKLKSRVIVCAVDEVKMFIKDNGEKEVKTCKPGVDFCSIIFTSPVEKTEKRITNLGLNFLDVADHGTCGPSPNSVVTLIGFPRFVKTNPNPTPMRNLVGKELPVPPGDLPDNVYNIDTAKCASGSPINKKNGQVKAIHVIGNKHGNKGLSFDIVREELVEFFSGVSLTVTTDSARIEGNTPLFKFLDRLSLEKYSSDFEDENINLESLLDCDRVELDQIFEKTGLTVGHQLIIKRALEKEKNNNASPDQPPRHSSTSARLDLLDEDEVVSPDLPPLDSSTSTRLENMRGRMLNKNGDLNIRTNQQEKEEIEQENLRKEQEKEQIRIQHQQEKEEIEQEKLRIEQENKQLRLRNRWGLWGLLIMILSILLSLSLTWPNTDKMDHVTPRPALTFEKDNQLPRDSSSSTRLEDEDESPDQSPRDTSTSALLDKVDEDEEASPDLPPLDTSASTRLENMRRHMLDSSGDLNIRTKEEFEVLRLQLDDIVDVHITPDLDDIPLLSSVPRVRLLKGVKLSDTATRRLKDNLTQSKAKLEYLRLYNCDVTTAVHPDIMADLLAAVPQVFLLTKVSQQLAAAMASRLTKGRVKLWWIGLSKSTDLNAVSPSTLARLLAAIELVDTMSEYPLELNNEVLTDTITLLPANNCEVVKNNLIFGEKVTSVIISKEGNVVTFKSS